MPDATDLLITRTDRVVTVELNRPHRRNALTRGMYAALGDLCLELVDDRDTRVLVLRGAGGKAFAAGNEITDFLGTDGAAYEAWIHELLDLLHGLPQVTVAAVDGACVGGGLAIATHCDLRLATPHSRFGLPIARTLGNALSAELVYRCAAVFGESLTSQMLLTGRLVSADRAYAVGALTEVVDDLDAALTSLVSDLLAGSGVTQRASKGQLHARATRSEHAPDGDAEMLAQVYAGADFAEGVRAFTAKERPRFGR